MTTTTERSGGATAPPEATARQHGSLTGTGTLLRFMLRRDRVRLPVWVLALTALWAYFANAIAAVMDAESLAGMATMAANPVMALIGGPGYGFDDITVARLLAGFYVLYLMLGTAFMSITTLSRHTRVEEQTGRAELVRANVLGRHSQLTAALIMATLMSLLVAGLTALVTMGSTIEPAPEAGPSLLIGAGIGAAGLAFAGIGAITTQLSAFSRAGSGIAGAVLGAAFVLRGIGDMSTAQDGGLSWLSWLSPLGWSQQTAPFTLDRWWPLLLSVALAVAGAAVGYALQARRDLAAGVLPDRLGAARAATWLSSPLALAYRLQRPSIIGWSVAMVLAGLTFGAFAEPMREGAADMPEEIVSIMGGADGLLEGYLGFMGIYFALIIAAYVIVSVQSLRGEEQGVRAEPVLATAVSRTSWLGSWTVVTAAGALWLLVLAGIAQGLGAVIGTGDWSLLGPVVLGNAVHVAAAWLFLGLAIALYGLAPRLVGLVWIVFVYGTVLSLFGEMLEFDQAILDTSPFQHVGQHPAEDVAWLAVGILTGIGALLVAAGAAAFRRRDLTTA
ncbi:ABC transporter permease [Saccharomonospora sp. CUA-673]|uniref:ABC transporter permease n=1 Tax=Saccharomonospora sp. CUA-673 TaxID=1904969 RepID=UPI00095E6D2E|nr:ABC transporter permease [Saccharomonospora sp. CUA-673]OLT48414.1 ABC transporter permease [Saccharomonospora sp. CUA-673]